MWKYVWKRVEKSFFNNVISVFYLWQRLEYAVWNIGIAEKSIWTWKPRASFKKEWLPQQLQKPNPDWKPANIRKTFCEREHRIKATMMELAIPSWRQGLTKGKATEATAGNVVLLLEPENLSQCL